MQIEYIYKCKRCDRIIKITGEAVQKENVIIDELVADPNKPVNHYCDKKRGIIGVLELIGINV